MYSKIMFIVTSVIYWIGFVVSVLLAASIVLNVDNQDQVFKSTWPILVAAIFVTILFLLISKRYVKKEKING